MPVIPGAATYRPATKSFQANFTRGQRHGVRRDYAKDDVDFFAIYCAGLPEVAIYIIPAGAVRNRSPRLYPHRTRLLTLPAGASLDCFLNAFEVLR